MYGPVPTGFWLMFLAGSLILLHTCSAMIGVLPTIAASSVNDGCGKVSTAVWSSLASADVIFRPVALIAGVRRIRSNVYATSLALNGWPSDHFTPSRVVMVSWVPLASQEYPVARIGAGFAWVAKL